MTDLHALIRDVPDFPKKGILFKDITPLLASPAGLALAVEMMVNPFRGRNIQAVIGAESRGFIFGTAVAQALSCGFIPVRKPGKLPGDKVSLTYDLEYGQDTMEMHRNSFSKGARCLMVDDLLATGGTMRACCDIVESLGGEIIGISFLIELAFLSGRKRFPDYEIYSVLKYQE